MTQEQLDLIQIEQRAKVANKNRRVWLLDQVLSEDIPALIAEVKRLKALEQERIRLELAEKRQIDEVTDLAMQGLLVDGWFHKQWYLEKILQALRVDFVGNYKKGIAP